jgi:tetratricopeptide (TPR) repeat protein
MIKETTEALRMDQTNPDLYFKRTKAYQALAQPNKAYADYSEAIRLFPKAMYYVGRASLFYQLNKPMLVDADVRSAIATDPTTPRTIHFGGDKFPANVRWGGDGPDGN